MGVSRVFMIWTVVILAIVSAGNVSVDAQSSPMGAPVAAAPGPGAAATDCMTLLYNMSDCLTYAEKGSNATKPDKPCCPEIAGMLDSKPVCLCQLVGNSKDLPVELDVSRALKLPSICGLQTPPLSMCSMVGVPIGGAPAGSPTSSEGPSSSSSAGMSPMGMAGEPPSMKNGGTSAHVTVAYIVAGLGMALTSFTS